MRITRPDACNDETPVSGVSIPPMPSPEMQQQRELAWANQRTDAALRDVSGLQTRVNELTNRLLAEQHRRLKTLAYGIAGTFIGVSLTLVGCVGFLHLCKLAGLVS